MDNTALILANLTPEDDRRFHAARISYSGSTGAGAKPESYNGLAPYIATYASQLHHAVKAMGWEKFSIEATAVQWIVRCEVREYVHEEPASLRGICDDAQRLFDTLMSQQKIGGAATLDEPIDTLEIVGRLSGYLIHRESLEPTPQ